MTDFADRDDTEMATMEQLKEPFDIADLRQRGFVVFGFAPVSQLDDEPQEAPGQAGRLSASETDVPGRCAAPPRAAAGCRRENQAATP